MSFSATWRWTGSRLLGHPDRPHPAFADLLDQLVRPDESAEPLAEGRLIGSGDQAAVGVFGQIPVRGGADLPVGR